MQVLIKNMNNPWAVMFGKKGHTVHTNSTEQMEEATESKQKKDQFPHRHSRKETICKVEASQYQMQFKYHLGWETEIKFLVFVPSSFSDSLPKFM